MILGFAHITRNINPPPYVGGVEVPNAPEKWRLMQHKAKWHRLAFHSNRGLNEETVTYDTEAVTGNGCRLFSCKGEVRVDARDPCGEVGWLTSNFGFRVGENGILHLVRPMPQWCVKVLVRRDASAPIDPPLDVAGYAAIAFYSSDVEADRDRLVAAGGRTPTEPFRVTIDREMKIIMLRSPEGTIIELIEVRT